jgi:methyl-CpG-binding domain protein 4
MLSYEERRARNVARNSAMFGHLGLETAAATVLPGGSAKPSAPKRRKTAKAAPREPTRRSSRARGAAPLYTGERIDHFGDDEEGGSSEYDGSESDGGSGGGGGGAAARRRAAAQLKEQRRKQNDVDEVLKASAQWLAESRAALLGQLGGGSAAVVVKAEPGSGGGGGGGGGATKAADATAMLCAYEAAEAAEQEAAAPAGTPAYFRAQAVQRWGHRVPAAGAVPPGWDWEAYLLSRLATPPPPAPPDVVLLQERFCGCCWRLLVSCTLMSRVSSAAVKDAALGAFFAAYPTPSAALEADPAAVHAILQPLGLFPNRMRSVVEVSRAFLAMPRFDVGLKPPLKIYGIGEFGLDSFHIFCRDRGATLAPADRNLAAYCRWRAKVAAVQVKAEPRDAPGGARRRQQQQQLQPQQEEEKKKKKKPRGAREART